MISRRGMTLIEVVVSLWILFVALAMAVGTLHRAIRHARQQEHVTRAALLAEQRMEELMVEPPRGLEDGGGLFEPPFRDYRWRLEVEPFATQTEKIPFLRLRVTVIGPAGAHFVLVAERRGWSDVLWFASNDNPGRRSRLYQVAEDGDGLLEIATGDQSANDSQPSLSPDGRQVAFVSDRDGGARLYLMPTEGSPNPRCLTPEVRMAQEPAFSPDGRHLAYTVHQDGFSQVAVLDLAAGKTRTISRPDRHEGSPAWAPGGSRLAVVVSDAPGAGSRIELVGLDGESVRTLVDHEGWNTAPDFSPDGRTLVFMSSRDGNPELYSVSVDGGSPRRLTDDPGYETEPAFSPDGRRIAFWTTRRGTAELFVMAADGSGARPVSRREEALAYPLFEKGPCWMPPDP